MSLLLQNGNDSGTHLAPGTFDVSSCEGEAHMFFPGGSQIRIVKGLDRKNGYKHAFIGGNFGRGSRF